MSERDYEVGFEVRDDRLAALQHATAEILFDELYRAGVIERDAFAKVEGLALKVAEGVLHSLWPWCGCIDVARVEDDLRLVGPFKPVSHHEDDDIAF